MAAVALAVAAVAFSRRQRGVGVVRAVDEGTMGPASVVVISRRPRRPRRRNDNEDGAICDGGVVVPFTFLEAASKLTSGWGAERDTL